MSTTIMPAEVTDTLLRPEDAAERLGLSPRTLADWRNTGKGPAYVRLSHRAVRYRPCDLAAWAASRVFTSTPAEAAAASRA